MIAGEFQGARGPARTFMPVNLWDVRLKAGHGVDLRLPSGYTTAPFILRGTIRPNLSEKAGEVELVLFDRDGEQITIDAEEGSSILVLNGEPIDEPIASYGPFVMNTQEEIRQAIDDYRSGRIGSLPLLSHR